MGSYFEGWRDVAGLGVDLSLFVNNLTDKFYYNSAVSAVANLGTGAVGIASPRMWGATVRVPFGGAAQ